MRLSHHVIYLKPLHGLEQKYSVLGRSVLVLVLLDVMLVIFCFSLIYMLFFPVSPNVLK